MTIDNQDEFLRALLSVSGDCIKIVDLEGRLRFMSEGGQKVMEVDDFSKLEGCYWPDFWVGDENPKATEAIKAAKEGRRAEFEGFATTAKGSPRWWRVVVTPINGADGKPAQLLSVSTDISKAREAQLQQRALMEELQHRVKNTLAVVQAIARQTFKSTANSQANNDFFARLVALGHAHDRLLEQDWASADVGPLVRGTVNVFNDSEKSRNDSEKSRVHAEGPSFRLAPKPALALALVVHELGNNASKYGSLSNDQGRVDIRWDCVGEGDDKKFVFEWKESGGPKVKAPKRKGLGTLLMGQGLGAHFGGSAKLDYPPDGVSYTIEAPLSAIKEQAVQPSA